MVYRYFVLGYLLSLLLLTGCQSAPFISRPVAKPTSTLMPTPTPSVEAAFTPEDSRIGTLADMAMEYCAFDLPELRATNIPCVVGPQASWWRSTQIAGEGKVDVYYLGPPPEPGRVFCIANVRFTGPTPQTYQLGGETSVRQYKVGDSIPRVCRNTRFTFLYSH